MGKRGKGMKLMGDAVYCKKNGTLDAPIASRCGINPRLTIVHIPLYMLKFYTANFWRQNEDFYHIRVLFGLSCILSRPTRTNGYSKGNSVLVSGQWISSVIFPGHKRVV